LTEKENKQFYVVSGDILPQAILRTAQVKEMLQRKDVLTVNQAVEKANVSRSAFYKYRDGVFPFYQVSQEKIITLVLLLEHCPGVLSNVLNQVASLKGNILSINQSIPHQGVAMVTMSVDAADLTDAEDLIRKLQALEGIKKVEIIAHS
jgi:chorismate mutase